jgi:hypothetical protein
MSAFVYGSRPYNTFPYNSDVTVTTPDQVFMIDFRGYIEQKKDFRGLSATERYFLGYVDQIENFGRIP